MKDTMRMKAIKDADIKKSNKVNKQKISGFGAFVNTFGIVLLVIMLTIVGVNFARDARIFEKPLLTSETNGANSAVQSKADTGSVSGTIKYKKPASESSGSTDKNTSTESGKSSESSKGNTTVTPTPTPDP